MLLSGLEYERIVSARTLVSAPQEALSKWVEDYMHVTACNTTVSALINHVNRVEVRKSRDAVANIGIGYL
jgi:hypothetical protein